MSASSGPDLEKFVQPMPVPETKEPEKKNRRANGPHYEMAVEEFETNLHPDLPKTTLWGYDGQFPGPVVEGWKGKSLSIEFDNSDLPTDHVFDIDDRIGGCNPADYHGFDGSVPDVRTVTHFHGLNVAPESDGQADMWDSPEGPTGPRYDGPVQEFPNEQPRTSTTYHDHALGISRLNNYLGLVGPYLIKSAAERSLNLPRGEYDVPLVLTDRSFEEDGSLHYPSSFRPNVAGDTAVVNGAVWPYMEVEPRRYRFRILNPSNGRTYGLHLENESSTHGGVPHVHQIAPGHGFLEDVVTVGHGGDLERLLIAPFERADVVVDFSGHEGETLTLKNDAAFPFGGGHGGDEDGDHGEGGDEDAGLTDLLQFRVSDPGQSVADPSTPATSLDLPGNEELPDSENPDPAVTRQMEMGMTADEYGLPKHVLNGKGFHDPIQAKPELDSVEVWELTNNTMHTHPIHLHLVQFRVIGRGPDGTDDPLPNERGGKDTVRVNPGETVRIAVRFTDHTGQFPWHCHILEHEDHEMMRPFEVVDTDGDDGGNGNGNGNNGNGRGNGKGR